MTNPNDLSYPHEEKPNGTVTINHNGLTKREYFAGLALQGILAYYPVRSIEDGYHDKVFQELAEQSVLLANKLIEELNKEKK